MFAFRILWWIESSKEQHFIWNRNFCNIINVLAVTFNQFNATLLIESINLFFLNLTDPFYFNFYIYFLFMYYCILYIIAMEVQQVVVVL